MGERPKKGVEHHITELALAPHSVMLPVVRNAYARASQCTAMWHANLSMWYGQESQVAKWLHLGKYNCKLQKGKLSLKFSPLQRLKVAFLSAPENLLYQMILGDSEQSALCRQYPNTSKC